MGFNSGFKGLIERRFKTEIKILCEVQGGGEARLTTSW